MAVLAGPAPVAGECRALFARRGRYGGMPRLAPGRARPRRGRSRGGSPRVSRIAGPAPLPSRGRSRRRTIATGLSPSRRPSVVDPGGASGRLFRRDHPPRPRAAPAPGLRAFGARKSSACRGGAPRPCRRRRRGRPSHLSLPSARALDSGRGRKAPLPSRGSASSLRGLRTHLDTSTMRSSSPPRSARSLPGAPPRRRPRSGSAGATGAPSNPPAAQRKLPAVIALHTEGGAKESARPPLERLLALPSTAARRVERACLADLPPEVTHPTPTSTSSKASRTPARPSARVRLVLRARRPVRRHGVDE